MSGWAEVLTAVLAMAGSGAAVLWRGGKREGKVDACLEHLTAIAVDHEDRLRALERRRRG